MTGNKNILSAKFVITVFFIAFFLLIIVNADEFSSGEQKLEIGNSFVGLNDSVGPEISADDIINAQVATDDKGVINYVVQPSDTLESIASTFGTTVSHIKKVNNIQGSIQAKQVLLITEETDGFIYAIPEKTNIVVFANKYNLNLQDLMSLNYIQDESEILFPGQEIFINVSIETAYNKGLLERPKPVIVNKPANRPVISKPASAKPSSSNRVQAVQQNNLAPSKKSTIISQRAYTKKINNKFYPGYCTWYAAIISPEIFKYTDSNTQDRPFGGDARQWCANAKAAGYSVGKKPAAGALIVYKAGRLSSAGHVGKVISYYADDGKMIVRDMNYVAKFVVTERREYTSNANISCYIYGK